MVPVGASFFGSIVMLIVTFPVLFAPLLAVPPSSDALTTILVDPNLSGAGVNVSLPLAAIAGCPAPAVKKLVSAGVTLLMVRV